MQDPKTSLDMRILLAAVWKKLEAIDTKLEKKVAYLPTEDAVEAYLRHLDKGLSRRGRLYAKPQNDRYWLEQFRTYFLDRNVAEITPEELEGFVERFWGNSKATTIKQRKAQLKNAFNFFIKYLQRKGSTIFNNPCNLLEATAITVVRPDFIPEETMKAFIESAINVRQSLAFALMATAGLRVGEVVKLSKGDINGRILTLRWPKSGREIETAIIPLSVAERLESYLKNLSSEKVFPINVRTIYDAVRKHGKNLKLDISPHDLRKWIITYWERQEDYAMVDFVSRHSSVTLKGRYIAPLTAAEIFPRQDTSKFFSELFQKQ